MGHEVFDTLNRVRELQAQYAACRAEQHCVTAQGMCCATTARLEAIDLERCRWEGVHRDEIKALESLCKSAPPVWSLGLAPSDMVAVATI